MSGLNKAKLRWYMEQFASTTVIRVFNFIRISNNLVERSFWILLVIVFAGFTVKDAYSTIEKYFAEPTSSYTEIRKNSSIFLRSPIICFQLDLDELAFKFDLSDMDKVDQLINHFKFSNISKVFEVGIAEKPKFVGMHSSLAESFSTVLKMNPVIPKETNFLSLLYAVSMVINNVIRVENSIGYRLDPHRNNWGLIDFRSKIVDNSTSLALAKISRFLSEKHSNYKLLLRQISALYCALLKTKLFSFGLNPLFHQVSITVEFPCIMRNSYWFGDVNTFAGRPLVCTQVADSKIFEFRETEAPSGVMYSLNELYSDSRDGGLNIGIDFVGSFGAKFKDYAFASRQGVSCHSISKVSGVYWSQPLKRRSCSVDSTFMDCYKACRIKLLQTNCKCEPMSNFQQLRLPTLPICGTYHNHSGILNPYAIPFLAEGNCVNLTKFGLDDSFCHANCFESCQTLMLTHNIYPHDNEINLFNNAAIYISKISTFSYPEVVELKSMELRDLITCLGGNLSLWLGASFLAIIHIVVFFFTIPFKH